MARDPIESLAVIPNASDNFDEVWVVVSRANGRMIERFVRRLKESDCGETRVLLSQQVFMDSTVSYEDGNTVSSITASGDNIYTIFVPSHGYSNGDTVVLSNIVDYDSLNNTKWIIGNVTENSFQLLSRAS